TPRVDWSQIGGGGGLQSTRGVHISETRKSANSPAVFLEGKLKKGDDGYLTFKSGDKEYQVASPPSDRIVPYPPGNWRSINPTWVNGLLAERNVTLKGTLSAD